MHALAAAGDVIDALSNAIAKVRYVDPLQFHARVVDMYSWSDVATRTLVRVVRVRHALMAALARR